MNVFYSDSFREKLNNFPKSDQAKILAFVIHVKSNGLVGLEGRNKSSDNVPTDDPEWLKKVKFAQSHQLWHYHIGIPDYDENKSTDKTSEYILHYIKGDDFIKIVELSPHPPFTLPDEIDLI